jgi:two-component system cell cycle response regulator
VTHCDTAEAAIEKFKKESFDLVLTDIVLAGGMSGLELIKHIREHESIFIRTPILAMSSQTGSEQVVELLSAGANDYVHKPVLLEELSVRISHLVQHRQLLEKLHTQSQRLERLAMHDQLTGLYNRHFLMEIAPQHISYAQRNSAPLSILVIDIDKFKSINDTHGHLMGDQVLSAISNLLTEACRREDILVRYGGEEFVALMHCDLESCAQKAEFLRKKIAELKPNNIVVTASFGVTSLHTEETDFYSFFQRSDNAVYEAKHNGRNCIEINP